MKKLKTILTVFSLFAALTVAASQPVKHCKGTTKKGEACQSTFVVKGTDYCRLHNPSAAHCTFIKKDGTACKMVVNKGQTLCRFHSK